MADLGTKLANDLRAHARVASLTFARGTLGGNDRRPHRRSNPFALATYLADRASFIVRLNGRPCNMYSGPVVRDFAPWSVAGQPLVDSFGLIFYHPHEHQILWSVSPGTRVLTITVNHTAGSGPKPFVKLDSDLASGVAAQTVNAIAADNTPETITINVTPTIAATLLISLASINFAETSKTTWGTITTT